MSKTASWGIPVELLLAMALLTSACAGGNGPSPPEGQADGRPTLVYLWTFP